MEIELIKPFVASTVNVLKTMAATELKVGEITRKHDTKSFGAVTGLIGLAGDQVCGNLVLGFDRPSILGIVERMLFEKFTEIQADVVDAVGELTNMICGGAKAELSNQGFKFNLASPTMIIGEGLEIQRMGDPVVLHVPFVTQDGRFVLEANLTRQN